jgi:hypothetical protein
MMRSCKCFPHVSKMLILKDKRENSVSVKILNIMHINVQNNNYYAYLLYIYIYIYIYVLTLNKIDLLTYLHTYLLNKIYLIFVKKNSLCLWNQNCIKTKRYFVSFNSNLQLYLLNLILNSMLIIISPIITAF